MGIWLTPINLDKINLGGFTNTRHLTNKPNLIIHSFICLRYNLKCTIIMVVRQKRKKKSQRDMRVLYPHTRYPVFLQKN